MIEPVQVLGQPAMRLRAPDGAQATVLLHGAHIVSWIPAGDVERLYLSPQAVAGEGQAVRGGIPVIFPQFEKRGPLPRHGFARNRAWQWVEGVTRGGHVIGVLRLGDDEATRALWPHRFEAELSLSLSGLRLDVELAVTNTGDSTIAFTTALHTYLRCDDVRRARLGGLYGLRYLDSLSGQEQRHEIDPQSFVGEIDRIYFDTTGPLSLSTAMGRMSIETEGFADAVVWNPGPDKAKSLADLPDDDWLRMLCVEAACIGHPVRVAPGEEWSGRQGFEA
ncbi:D-hexose-6-phosphate mutarotase [Aquabacterium sp.]|uniref:D-hexose-6-phosphate mutarotase n=1 Tax=Aquabacterium sp. TaxID=1872578 RepID=UPI002C9583E2|nr:D-hexose-6-phosphate mutarotase [Aquabacterium sp.]HSW08188.1 D-hexose-6-phosphate mutarotase [Aquabacterium sp.]